MRTRPLTHGLVGPFTSAILFSILTLFLLHPRSTFAWGHEGHQVVGLIAEGLLSPKVLAECDRILLGEKLGDHRVASWADFVRGNKSYERKYPDNDRWHYINLDLSLAESDFALPEDKNEVVSQVLRWHYNLAHAGTTDETKRDALRFLVHFVADLHQPLHCANRNDDYGGNRLPIYSFRGDSHVMNAEAAREDRLNLHVVWDVSLVKEAMRGGTVTNLAKELVAELDDEKSKAWRVGDPETWVWPVHNLAVKHAYCFTDGTPLPGKEEQIRLSKNTYIRSNVPIVREQLLKAGVRLAAMIEQAVHE